MGSIRHKNPLLCCHGALAQYLFWRFHVSGEEPPSFRGRRGWYDTKLLVTTASTAKATANRTGAKRKLVGSKPGGGEWAWNETELSYIAQVQEIWRIFETAGITSVEKTHAMRGCAARAAELHGVPDPQVSPSLPIIASTDTDQQIARAGLWTGSSMVQSYLTGLPLQFIRSMAGFGTKPGKFYLPRANHVPPLTLQQQVFPWVEQWEERVRLLRQGKVWSEGGLDQEDLALEGFIKLIKYLRVVLLQDMAVLQASESLFLFYFQLQTNDLSIYKATLTAPSSLIESFVARLGTTSLNSSSIALRTMMILLWQRQQRVTSSSECSQRSLL